MERQRPRRGADVAACEAHAEQIERGEPLPGMTLPESVAHLACLAVAGGWRTPGERERAWVLFLRLASLGWRVDAAGRGGRLAPAPRTVSGVAPALAEAISPA
jgi:hypothetical protein